MKDTKVIVDVDSKASPAATQYLRLYLSLRAATEALVRPLTAEDMTAQSMPDTSPTKWHLAHTTWFFETFLLTPHLPGYKGFDPRFSFLFNSYYEAIGARQPRPARGLITRPSVTDVMAYRAHVDAGMLRLLSEGWADEGLVALGLAHEEQHQELILMDVLHLFSLSPLFPAFTPPRAAQPALEAPPAWRSFSGGLAQVGRAEGQGFAFDNEGPRHRIWLEPFKIADRLVTNAEWLAFMADDGYRRPEYWLSEGWALCRAEGWRAPFYWHEDASGWRVMGLQGLRPVDPSVPVSHVSYYEADAYATWAGARLPSEMEWEHAATAAPGELNDLFGQVWQWTRSAYLPYPGYRPAPGAVGEYNGKFMAGQFVLRGGAFATAKGHSRATYRNFFYPHQRWMFAGVRLAGDAAESLLVVSNDFEKDVLAGLAKTQKQLPPKHFYDAEGSRLFEAITELAEYYPTRTEIALLREAAGEISTHIPQGAALVEFGSGASVKTRILLDVASQIDVYAPVDISAVALEHAAHAIRADYPRVTVAPLCDDFTNALSLPREASGRPVVGFFPGSTLGNFTPDEARAFLIHSRRLLGQGAAYLIGIDLVKDPAILVAAYDDASGVTAAFNKNLLTRINRELGGDFDLDAFAHRAQWNAAEQRMEMHLVSLKDQDVCIRGKCFAFATGETLHTENSYKFTLEGFCDLAGAAGWAIQDTWVSDRPEFALVMLRA